jgi:hypothetical protein
MDPTHLKNKKQDVSTFGGYQGAAREAEETTKNLNVSFHARNKRTT